GLAPRFTTWRSSTRHSAPCCRGITASKTRHSRRRGPYRPWPPPYPRGLSLSAYAPLMDAPMIDEAALNDEELYGEGQGTLINDDSPRIKPGRYSGRYLYHETRMYLGKTPKLIVYFNIATVDQGLVAIPRNYNVFQLEGPPRRYGGFAVK